MNGMLGTLNMGRIEARNYTNSYITVNFMYLGQLQAATWRL